MGGVGSGMGGRVGGQGGCERGIEDFMKIKKIYIFFFFFFFLGGGGLGRRDQGGRVRGVRVDVNVEVKFCENSKTVNGACNSISGITERFMRSGQGCYAQC